MSDIKPDATRLFSLLRRLTKGGKLSPDETHELSELIHTMAGANVITEIASFKEAMLSRIDSKFDTLSARMDAQSKTLSARMDAQSATLSARMDAQDSKLKFLAWLIGIIGGVFGIIGIIVAYGTFLAG